MNERFKQDVLRLCSIQPMGVKASDFREGEICYLNSGSPPLEIWHVYQGTVYCRIPGLQCSAPYDFRCLTPIKYMPLKRHVSTNTIICYN